MSQAEEVVGIGEGTVLTCVCMQMGDGYEEDGTESLVSCFQNALSICTEAAGICAQVLHIIPSFFPHAGVPIHRNRYPKQKQLSGIRSHKLIVN